MRQAVASFCGWGQTSHVKVPSPHTRTKCDTTAWANYMNLLEAFRTWRRHWILTTFLVAIALAGSFFAFQRLPRTYQAESTIVLIPSAQAAKTLGSGNPYLSFTDALATTADLVTTELTAPQTERQLTAEGFADQYSAVSESTTGQATASGSVLPGPFIVLLATGKSKDSVELTLNAVTATVRSEVDVMQARLPRNARISVSTLSYSPQATMNVSATARPLVLIIGLLIVLALCIPLIVDAQVRRIRMRRKADSAPCLRATTDSIVPRPQERPEVGHRPDPVHQQVQGRSFESRSPGSQRHGQRVDELGWRGDAR